MEQRVSWKAGADLPICTEEVNKLTKKMNADGFELTLISVQCRDNNPSAYTEAMLVFTKK